jgi:vacuolar-type H+-ATPase subunit H
MTTPEAPEAPSPSPADPAAPAGPPEGDKGFPEGTPLTEMTDAQKAAYWQHYARKHEDTVKAFKGLTPQQVSELQAKVEELEAKSLSADEKLLKAARDEAAKQARAQAEAEYLPQIRAAKVQSIASQIITGDQLAAFMELVDTTRLLGESGQVDESKVMGYLTAIYGTAPAAPARWPALAELRSAHTAPTPAEKRVGRCG